MLRLLTIPVILLLTGSIYGQDLLCTEKLSVDFGFFREGDSIAINKEDKPLDGSYVQIESLRLVGTDLHMKYLATKQKDGFEYVVGMMIKEEGRWDVVPSKLDVVGDMIISANGRLGELIWRDFFEEHGSLIKNYELVINVELFGETHVRCDQELVHPFSRTVEKGLLITGMTAGVGMLTAGQISRISANKNQRSYRDNWLSGKSYEDSQELNLKAESQKKNYQTLTIAGGVTIIAASLYWWLRERHFRKDKKEYRKYCDCEKSIAFAPYIETNDFSDYASLGLTMKIRIK